MPFRKAHYLDDPDQVPPTAKSVEVQIRCYADAEWHPVGSLRDRVGPFLTQELNYLNDEIDLPLERWAFAITVDGRCWNQDYWENELHVSCWIEGLASLARGDQSATVWAWEESNCTLRRFDDLVTMVDWWHEKLLCPKVTVSLPALVRDALPEIRDFIEFKQLAAQSAKRLPEKQQKMLEDLTAWQHLERSYTTLSDFLARCS